jgi:hypothetical protein
MLQELADLGDTKPSDVVRICIRQLHAARQHPHSVWICLPVAHGHGIGLTMVAGGPGVEELQNLFRTVHPVSTKKKTKR